jgi:hypothetical protein
VSAALAASQAGGFDGEPDGWMRHAQSAADVDQAATPLEYAAGPAEPSVPRYGIGPALES